MYDDSMCKVVIICHYSNTIPTPTTPANNASNPNSALEPLFACKKLVLDEFPLPIACEIGVVVVAPTTTYVDPWIIVVTELTLLVTPTTLAMTPAMSVEVGVATFATGTLEKPFGLLITTLLPDGSNE
jgi:hypothetical protein